MTTLNQRRKLENYRYRVRRVSPFSDFATTIKTCYSPILTIRFTAIVGTLLRLLLTAAAVLSKHEPGRDHG